MPAAALFPGPVVMTRSDRNYDGCLFKERTTTPWCWLHVLHALNGSVISWINLIFDGIKTSDVTHSAPAVSLNCDNLKNLTPSRGTNTQQVFSANWSSPKPIKVYISGIMLEGCWWNDWCWCRVRVSRAGELLMLGGVVHRHSDLWMRKGSICTHQLWVSLHLDRIYEDIFNVSTRPQIKHDHQHI